MKWYFNLSLFTTPLPSLKTCAKKNDEILEVIDEIVGVEIFEVVVIVVAVVPHLLVLADRDFEEMIGMIAVVEKRNIR